MHAGCVIPDKDTLAGLTVLVVEDEALLRKQLTAQLEKLGAAVSAVPNLKGARQSISEQTVDLALLDVNLPDGNGIVLLRDRAFSAHTGVIMMTADGNVADAVEAMRLGAVDYLVKPFDLMEIPLVLGRVRRAKRGHRAEEHRRDRQMNFYFGPSLAALQVMLDKILAADRRIEGPLPPVLIEG